ncbi:MAG: ATP-binding protein [Myxococcota bacterium]
MRIAIALLVVAAVGGLSLAGANQIVRSLNHDAPTINVSGRQRMLSQRVALMVSRYVASPPGVERERVGRLLDDSIATMASSHAALVDGRPAMGISGVHSPAVRELYHGEPRLDLQVSDYLGWARTVRRLPEPELRLDHPAVVRLLAAAERPLLRDLNQAVTLYENESSSRVADLNQLQRWLFGVMLVLLTVEALVLFWPLVEQLAQQFADIRKRERAHRLVLDNTVDALFVIDPAGRIQPGWSGQLEARFGSVTAGTPFWEVLHDDADDQEWTAVAFGQVQDVWLPREVALAQLPGRLRRQRRDYRVTYHPLDAADSEGAFLISVVDVTDELAASLADRERRELHDILVHVLESPVAFVSFRDEAVRLFDDAREALENPDGIRHAALLRVVHTLADDTAIFGFRTVSEGMHALEALLEAGAESDLLEALSACHQRFSSDLAKTVPYLGATDDTLTISVEELTAHVLRLREGVPHGQLLEEVQSWLYEPAIVPLQHLAATAERMARRRGKSIEVVVEDASARLPARPLDPFWGALVHVVRNAVGHGIEEAGQREAAGKEPRGRVALACSVIDDVVHVTVRDDGRGIDWDAVVASAEAAGMQIEGREREALLFLPGLSTHGSLDIAGEGEGLWAAHEATERLGGTIEVSSSPGQGTCLHFALPLRSIVPSQRALGPQTIEVEEPVA